MFSYLFIFSVLIYTQNWCLWQSHKIVDNFSGAGCNHRVDLM